MSKTYWRTRSGEKIDIDEMSVSHLRNALKMVVKYYGQPEQKKQTEVDYSHSPVMQRMNMSQEAWDTLGGTYVDAEDFYD